MQTLPFSCSQSEYIRFVENKNLFGCSTWPVVRQFEYVDAMAPVGRLEGDMDGSGVGRKVGFGVGREDGSGVGGKDGSGDG